MDARLLETLRAVHDHGGVTAAAAALHVTPSAVSQQVRVLQREVGAVLLERVGRGVRLTPAGAALAAAAVDVAVAVERARAAVDAHRAEPTGTVRVSAFQSAAQMLLPGLLTRVARLGGIALECSDEDVAQAEFGALTADFDVVVAHRPDRAPGWGGGLRVEPLLREPLDVALWPGHPLAQRATLEPADLAGEDWIAVREGFPVAAVLSELAAIAGSPPRIVQRINDFHVVEALVAAGHGISLLPRYTTGAAPDRLRLVPLAGVRAGRQIDALLRPDRAERLVVQRVLGELRTQAREIERSAAT
ncbi:LysR family transcriptional regulator [Cellulomonas cellasea]|uniref:DNA-binding transcriptional LysR family regulator n=1 Tax=Cellulomonas cellasea TaxID=43670 RepID=A0A7W4UJK4_9CELL|nr:LysR family transcriptional regulator [Cellulomonas cellasea]MBB2925349.1 DNA-binding transcriptional LysR family regulator [Cellulomonas cellasea]